MEVIFKTARNISLASLLILVLRVPIAHYCFAQSGQFDLNSLNSKFSVQYVESSVRLAGYFEGWLAIDRRAKLRSAFLNCVQQFEEIKVFLYKTPH